MNNMNKYKVCVIGAGKWGINHIRTLDSLNALGGIVEKNDLTIDKLKINYPNCKIFRNIDDALNEKFNGFIIATPPALHFRDAKLIIESGFHLLVEKPITLKKSEAVILNDLALKNKVNLMVGHLLLFHPAFRVIKRMIEDGELGDLQYIYSNRLNHGTIRTEENVFWSFAPHDIALFQYFFNQFPVSITSRGLDILQPNIHDTTITSFRYANNQMGHIFVSWLHPFKEHRFVIIGSKGMVHFEDSLEGKPLLFYNKSVDFKGDIPVAGSGSLKKINYKFEYPLKLQLKYFLDHLDGKKIKIADGSSAVEVMDILEKSSIDLARKIKNE